MAESDQVLANIVQSVQRSRKYRYVAPQLIERIARQEQQKRRTPKEAIKATKNKLHQTAGAYFTRPLDYPFWLDQFQQAATQSDPQVLIQLCSRMMARHASTQERLPILAQFYKTVLAEIGPVSSVLDLGCGLNPLAIPWLPLTADAHYYVCDIYTDLLFFLGEVINLLGVRGQAYPLDLVRETPPETVDLAILLKVLPVLEQTERGASLSLLRSLKAKTILVSFPVYSLGGRSKGMSANYEDWFYKLIADEGWRVERFAFATETCFLVGRERQ